MSGSLSIFQKLCPSCATSQPVGAARCDCGHVFESDGPGGASADEIALRDEELYENYLTARAAQAQEAARAAQDSLAEDPDSPEKAAAAELARQVAQSIQSDLAEQHRKITALRAAIPGVTPPAPQPTAQSIQARPDRPVVKKPVAASPVPKIVAPKPAPASAPPPPKSAAAVPATISLQPVRTPIKAIAALEALKSAKAREAMERTRHATAPAEPTDAVEAAGVPAKPPVPPTSVPSLKTVPPATFRAEQAAKAEKVMDALQAAPAQHKDCPNCTAAVPTNTTRCHCGFAFTTGGNDLPTLTLCTGDFTALRNSLNLNLRRGN